MQNDIDWNKNNIKKAIDSSRIYYNQVFEYLVKELNEYHGLDEKPEYYHIIIGDWLTHLIHQLYLKWIIVDNKKYNDDKITIEVSNRIDDYNVLRLGKKFNDDIKKSIYLFKNSYDFNQKIVLKKAVEKSTSSKIKSTTKLKNFFSRNLFNSENKKIIFFEPMRRNSHINFYSKAIKWNKWMGIKSNDVLKLTDSNIHVAWRKKNLHLNKIEVSFINFIKLIAPLIIPISILESFKANKILILKNNSFRPDFFYSATGLYYNAEIKILVAEWKKKGTKFLYHQHGGNYGLDDTHWMEEYETSCADTFYTWGWQSSSSNTAIKALSVPSIKVPNLKKTRVLLCVSDYSTIGHRIHYQPMGLRIKEMHNQTISFIDSFNSKLPLDIRMPQADYDFSIVSELKNLDKIRSIDKSTNYKYNFPFSYSKGNSLTVHSYLCTSWLETIGLDIPTICFYDAEVYKFREQTKLLIDKLERTGILHRSGKSAALFINKLNYNVDQWWFDNETLDARLSFKLQYANFSSTWNIEWEKEFRSLID